MLFMQSDSDSDSSFIRGGGRCDDEEEEENSGNNRSSDKGKNDDHDETDACELSDTNMAVSQREKGLTNRNKLNPKLLNRTQTT